MDNKKVIPINPKTACQNKWAWSSIYLNSGTSASCHRCKHYEFDADTIMDFHNLPGKLADRQKMLQGEWPGNGCEYCRDVEAVGGKSDRIPFHDRIDSLLPKEMYDDCYSVKVSPTILEVYFNNTCNQSCVYCRPRFSSQIEHEIRKHGPSKYNLDYGSFKGDDRPNYELYLKKFFEWMTINAKNLLFFKMLGGEPLYQQEFEMLLDFFDENPCPDLYWDIFTNMNHDNDKLAIKIEKIKKLLTDKKLKGIRFICSIDCWGPDVEYVRYGFNLENAEKNMNLLLATPGIDIQIHATISALSLPSMHLLGQKVKEWNSVKPMFFHWNTITSPACFDIYNFGDSLVEYVDKFIETLDNPIPVHQRTILGIKTRMLSSKVNINEITNLYGFLTELDKRRNENWKQRFPQIVEIINKITNVQYPTNR